MVEKAFLYLNTVRYLKPSQVYYRIGKKLGLHACIKGFRSNLGKKAPEDYEIATVEALNHDPAFLRRFSVEELMNDRVTFLHESVSFCFNQEWKLADKSPLWNFNLHYFEYLLALSDQFLADQEDRACLDKAVYMITQWVLHNPREKGGDGWSSYTISLRLTNWLAFYSQVKAYLEPDFKKLFICSVHEQYVYLAHHLEKDILGNHYFENLKTLMLCSLFFEDDEVYNRVRSLFQEECSREILSDGMHFELSPMYHKLILEDLIRTAYAVKQKGLGISWMLEYISKMLNACYSLESGLKRTPLFNDSGDNISKSLDSILKACTDCFGLKPSMVEELKSAGYYIFCRNRWKLILDAGAPGPVYIPGHSHCDAMSFELYYDGQPVFTNCGTYAYQCKERSFFRSTAAHNTVMAGDKEQSQCWSAFRLAKRSKTEVLSIERDFRESISTRYHTQDRFSREAEKRINKDSESRIDKVFEIRMKMTDYAGHVVIRRITIGFKQDPEGPDNKLFTLILSDHSQKTKTPLKQFYHLTPFACGDGPVKVTDWSTNGEIIRGEQPYAPEFGRMEKVTLLEISGENRIRTSLVIRENRNS